MATLGSSPADLPLEQLALYHAVDSCLSSILVFYGPVATANATVSSSRIQAHIFSPAGFQSYPRITVSPAAPLYAAVHHLPREKQGDEVCRGLAVCLLKYFAELSDPAKMYLSNMARSGRPGGRIPKMFDEMHAADLANRMAKVENASGIIRDVREAYRERKVPWIDVDVVLPAGTIQPPPQNDDQDSSIDADVPDHQYGRFTPLIRSLGNPIFLPTSRLRRAPSQPTNLSKSKLFTKIQKESLRLAMCEVVDTEERYVAKIYDLVHNVVEEFRRKAKAKTVSSTSPDESSLAALFPPCLNEILETNMGFLDVIRQVLEETEKDAIADISEDTDLQSSVSSRISMKEGKDPLGVIAFANALLEWFPRFSKPYADYMRAHTGFTQTLNSFLKDNNSSFSKRVYDAGEQKLRSLLMEPVQRLPRYSLLIDTMTSNLPLVHPAVRPFLKARDIIKDICSLDNSSVDYSQSIERLKSLVDGWPSSVSPAGRLITAVDFNEVPPPYRIDAQPLGPSSAIMLLYKNCLVLLAKEPGSRATARGLLAEVDNPATSVNESSGTVAPGELSFAQAFDLNDVRFMQSACGRVLYLIPAVRTSQVGQSDGMSVHALELSGMYDGRANRLIEEILKAKIEGRFSEQERENGKWTLRSPAGTFGHIGILASVFEEDQSGTTNRSGASNIRVVFDVPKPIRTKMLSSSDLEVVISVSSPSEDEYKVDIDSIVGVSTTDTVAVDDFIHVLSRRLYYLLAPLHHPRNPVVTEPIICTNFDILRCVASQLLSQAKVPRGFRPPSPSKLLSTLWGGEKSKEYRPGHSKSSSASAILLGDIPKMSPPKVNTVRPATSASSASQDESSHFRISVVGPASKHLDDHLKLLEQTFTAYILALQSRSGNIVGRTLRAREHVDRAEVNELYNVLLEDPGKIQAAAEVPVDILFVAFETFMSNAWRDHIGPVIAPSALKLIQREFDSMIPGNFEDAFRHTLGEMSPQNRRALAAMVRLLAELLDASGNDGDRGALTAAFAEVLTVDGDPMQYVSLLDRLVDDFDYLFDESTPVGSSVEGGLVSDPSGLLSKTQSSSAGSMSSNTSSFRRRFGFGLNRENSKSEAESKVSSILRTLSSKTRGSAADSESGTLKNSLLRSKSTDLDTRLARQLRPPSRDRPGVYGAFHSDEQLDRADSAYDNPPLSPDGEGLSNSERPRSRRKRRSSLSDLRPASSHSETQGLSPIQPLRSTTPKTPPQPGQGRPPSSHGTGSPSRDSPTRTSRKENVQSRSTLTERAINKKTDGPASPEQSLKKRIDGTGLKERSALTNRPESLVKRQQPSSSPQKPYKLRMHSPQKLRERLQNEKKAHASVEASFQAELALISDEISALKLQPSSTAGSSTKPAASNVAATLMTRVRNLESRLSTLTTDLENRTTALEKDLETSLIVSERRVKKLDELYREASAENEALYDRFNAELSKIVKDVRAGEGEESLKTQLREALEEVGRVKKENLRLKREIGGLKAQQVDGGPVKGE